MSTTLLDLRKPGSYSVEDFNALETLLVTADRSAAINKAAVSATDREGVVRIYFNVRGVTLDINTAPTALSLKVHAISFILFIVSHIAGAYDFTGPCTFTFDGGGDDESDHADVHGEVATPSTYELTFIASPVEIDPGQLVATPLLLAPELIRGDWQSLVAEVRRAFTSHGLGVVVNERPADDLPDDRDGVAISLLLNDNYGANFVDHPFDLPPSLYRIMEETPHERGWAASVALARTLPNVPGDDDANALVFWTRS